MSGTDVYDACVVGAGPAGATCAWYLARAGRRVLLLEKRAFPRDKICGDAVCVGGQDHLRTMGVLQEIEAENLGRWALVGGMLSPAGSGFIGDSVAFSGRRLVIAVKRRVLDEKIARASQRVGADLREQTPFVRATLDKIAGLWAVQAEGPQGPQTFEARCLVAADGAHSFVTRALGIPTPPPDGICSRAYVKAGTHSFEADGVAFYASELIPGYAALFKEADGDLNYCVYIIPGGKAQISDLRSIHDKLLKEHPYISKALGPAAQVERMNGAPLRLGGTRKTYYERLLVVGDAAGHIDPLTGEGIHTALEGGFIAADEIGRALDAGDLSERRLARYERRWMKAFGNDFRWSARMARIYTRFPIFVEASARAMQSQGTSLLYEWGKMMTGAAPKTGFLKPRMFMPVLAETVRSALRRAPRGPAPRYPTTTGRREAVEEASDRS
jgi:geranylgeranyl reductase family protein